MHSLVSGPRCLRALQWVLLLLCWGGSAHAEEAPAVEPSLNQTDSHKTFLERLKGSRGEIHREIVARYDAYLTQFPTHYQAAIERCKFLQGSFSGGPGDIEDEDEDEETDEEEEGPAVIPCAEALEPQYGQQPAVVLFRLSQLWGEAALTYGNGKLGDSDVAWSRSERALALGMLAQQHYTAGRLKEASEVAKTAWGSDPSYDPSYFQASYLASIEKRQPAIAALSQRMNEDRDAGRLLQKATLCMELDAPDLALKAIRAAAQVGGAYVDRIEQDSGLVAGGHRREARPLRG